MRYTIAVELLANTGMEVDRKGVKVEIATEVEREVAGIEKERGGSYNGVLVSYLHILWLVADVMVFVWCGFYGLASFHGLRITTKRLTLRLCKNHTFDLCVTTVTGVNLASHWLECLT